MCRGPLLSEVPTMVHVTVGFPCSGPAVSLQLLQERPSTVRRVLSFLLEFRRTTLAAQLKVHLQQQTCSSLTTAPATLCHGDEALQH